MTVRGTLTILFLVAVLFATSAYAQDIAVLRTQNAVLTLTDQRAGCDWAEGAKRARILLEGKEHLGCYVVVDKVVFIQWDDGDRDVVPTSDFKPTT
jgi:hypothetical protein